MGYSLVGEHPALLQLQKWGPSQAQLNLSEFREAFISPTRQLLLLLSYHCEAMLLPLLTGYTVNINSKDSMDSGNGAVTDPNALAFTFLNGSNVDDSFPSPSGSLGESNHEVSNGGHPFIADVKSLAWAACGDTYSHSMDAPFKDLLFVSGSYGVTVHAFCRHEISCQRTNSVSEPQVTEGRWMEWGPHVMSDQNIEMQESYSLFQESSGGLVQYGRQKGVEVSGSDIRKNLGQNEFLCSGSKRWLRSFFIKAETMKSEGSVRIRLPMRSSFPRSARVVSFSIFGSNLAPADFLAHRCSVREVKDDALGTDSDLVNDSSVDSNLRSFSPHFESDVLSSFLGCRGNCFYSCSRVFSSHSCSLVGFVLSLVDSILVRTTDESIDSEHSGGRTFVVVARLDSWGVQLISSVELGGNQSTVRAGEWTDFCFSENLLVCLTASGLISFYAVVSGEYVTHLDIMQSCGLFSHIKSHDQGEMHVRASLRTEQDVLTPGQAAPKSNNLCVRRRFIRLVGASYSSLFAAVDEAGLIYVICAGKYLPHKYYSNVKLQPPLQHPELGTLVGLEIAGFDIGRQMAQIGNPNGVLSHYASCSSGFSDSKKTDKRFHDLGGPLNFIRHVFLPTGGFSEDDCFCFSSLGVTRLIKRHGKDQCDYQIVHHNLHFDSEVCDDKFLNSRREMFHLEESKQSFVGEVVGCSFQGCFYLVTQCGLSVVLPSVSSSSYSIPLKSSGHQQFSGSSTAGMTDWEIEVLDRVILYEGPEVAERLCLENGWDLKVSRKRRLQMSLDYLKFDEIERSLEMLVGVSLAEEGILRILLRAAYLMFGKVGSDNELSAASRLLALASSFATKLIRMYGLLQQKKKACKLWDSKGQFSLLPDLPGEIQNEKRLLKNLQEMAHLLEITRNLQSRLVKKIQRPGQGLVHEEEALSLVDSNVWLDELSIGPADPESLKTSADNGISSSAAVNSRDSGSLLLTPMDYSDSGDHLDSGDFSQVSALVPQEQREAPRRTILPLENPKEMVARWKMDNLDMKNVVKDALFSGRLPLAVLQLHLHRSRELYDKDAKDDAFNEVREVGRAVAYDLFLKGETRLAIATLQRLGEEIKTTLKQLVFGTTRRSLRLQVSEEMEKFGYLGPYEWKILERISLIERLYPSSSFWRTFLGRREEFDNEIKASGNVLERTSFSLILPLYDDMKIECGEIDGIILGTWMNISASSSVEVTDEDGACAGYWAAAAVWSGIWDQRTVHRIVLDQPFLMGVHLLWESQLEYHICHNEWEEVARLLDLIPSSTLSDGRLQISLDVVQPSSVVGYNGQVSYHGDYPSPMEELDAVCMDVPDVRIFRFSGNSLCSSWLRMLMERDLAKRFIFLREFWESTSDIVPLLARSGFVTKKFQISLDDGFSWSSTKVKYSTGDGSSLSNSAHGLHRVLIRFCAQYSLPNLLDLFLDHHELALDSDSLHQLLEAVGDCQWARWLLYSRVKGQEYEASFSNACVIMTQNSVPNNIVLTDELIYTIDDIAEGGGELAALATLMYAPIPVQNCLSTGSVKRQSTSAQCTLENLRPALQHFPTLWRTFVGACLGQDPACNFSTYKGINGFSSSALLEYLNWRENIFCSSDRDTSLMQMLPCWFPKAVRRLVQLYIEDPLGWQSLAVPPSSGYLFSKDVDLFVNHNELAQISEISWEATIQRRIEEELFDSSVKETGRGLEHHLHRGRALAAFNHFLGVRVQKLKLEKHSGGSVNGQANIQLDIQTLLAPVTESEESLLSSVMPLAVTHFEDPVLVASCAFLLELCGLSTTTLRVDVAALRRISSFYKSVQNNGSYHQLSPKGSAFHAISQERDITESLARALADEYLQCTYSSSSKQKEALDLVSCKRASRSLMLVLHHLEKASLPPLVDEKTSGSWLHNGNGDGNELRSQQKAASRWWNLVIDFCQIHHIPLSTKYLAVLARDNDWVGFLSESQIGGYPFDVVMQLASKEFSDPRLKLHILTVLKNMQSRRKVGSSSSDSVEGRNGTSLVDDTIRVPVELFGILAECEKQKNPGEALLIKAKDLSWSILAMIASCFTDVTPLACLTVWLEITAARETSSIKVNDIASQIADNVASAVAACNSKPACDRAVALHYNRRSPKRRRLLETVPVDGSASNTRSMGKSPVTKVINDEEENKVEIGEYIKVSTEFGEGPASLSRMVAVLCEQRLFLPLLRAFEMFLPSCSLLPFIRALQAFSQMRLSEASAHLGSFAVRIKEESAHSLTNVGKEENIAASWICSTAVKAADAVLSSCPSPYEKRCLLQLLAATDFGDGGNAAVGYRRLYWKINLAEPSLRKDDLHLGSETLDDASLLTALEKNGHWEQARNWARQLEVIGGPWKSAVHHVTETQAESMVAEWMEFLWDVPEERVALWGHCQRLFIRYSFPPLQAGQFYLKHAETLEKDLPAKELHELLLLSLQWLSGVITASTPVYPLNLLREIETRVWLLAVESEAQMKSTGDFTFFSSNQDNVGGSSSSIIDKTASIITKMDNHITVTRNRTTDKHDSRDNTPEGVAQRQKRRVKAPVPSRRSAIDTVDRSTDSEDGSSNLNARPDLQLPDNLKLEVSLSRWEERVGAEELERAVLSLLEFGQISAAKQLQHKLSPAHAPSEFILVNAALKLAAVSTPWSEISILILDEEVCSVIQPYNIPIDKHLIDPLQVLERLITIFTESRGRGLCRRIIAVVRAANVLGLSFSEAFAKQPIEVLQLLSLKAQESFEEAKLLVRTHSMPSASIARILAESFLKGLLAAHRGGYLDSQQEEEGPAPLLWRSSDFLKWAELCPSEPEIGHALMRLVITGQEIPHTCEVELLILSHHFYKSSACLDGVDVLVALAANKVDSYVTEGDFSCLARLITGVGNFYALNFILGILIENGQLDLLLQKYSAAADVNSTAAESVRGFRMAVLTSLKQFNPNDLDAKAMVYNHFNMKHEAAALLESRAEQSSHLWFRRYDKDQNEDLLESMRLYIEAAEVHSSIDAGNKTRRDCALASLVSLQIRMPDFQWLNRTETNARRALVEQSRFQEALIVAEAYNLNQPSEWALVLWNQMLNPELIAEFVADFVAVLPLQPSMLNELARFYRAEVAARGDQSQFSVWLTGGGLPAEWAKYLARSFRCLLKRTRDLRLRLQMATVATGFTDVTDSCIKALDRVPENAGPLVLRRGHGGAYLPLM